MEPSHAHVWTNASVLRHERIVFHPTYICLTMAESNYEDASDIVIFINLPGAAWGCVIDFYSTVYKRYNALLNVKCLKLAMSQPGQN